MRKLITTIFMALSFTVSAEMPKYLEGATVTVTLKNGKTYTYKSEEYAVVPRKNLDKNLLKIKGFDIIHTKLINREIVKNRKNRAYIFLGYGADKSLDSNKTGDITEVSAGKGSIFGAGFMRKLNEKINIGLQIQNNGSGGVTVGTDF